ncbi:chymotrypsin-like elastase family member 2A isoform X2 [Diabrotica undecimpunctata]|uniref:chymotrypsin-like elastase family member 2A isoform X2 n=1 Tax=Diabrotica undecimpunctata TaxID=50387 RepID=UPI003B63D55F
MFRVEFTLVFLFLSSAVCQDLVSPCPEWFTYEARKPNEPDRIYGVINVLSDSDYNGIWLRNWFGIVTTVDNTLYKIIAENKKLLANVPITIPIYIKYDTSQPPPQLVEILLNGITVCHKKETTAEAPASDDMYFTSPELTSTQTPTEKPSRPSSRPNVLVNPPVNFINNVYANNGRPSSLEDDYFMGDFALLGKPRPNRPQYLEEQCGVVIKPAQPLITYGEPTREGEFPWHAALYYSSGTDLKYICGATLISKYHLITVAHCVKTLKTQNTLSPTSLIVYLGKYYLRSWTNPGIQSRQIANIVVHQNYNLRTFQHDIAILKLIEPAKITNYVRPVCLWEDDKNLRSVIERQGTVVGWGFDQNGRVTDQLTKAHMPVVSQTTCINSSPQFFSRFTSNYTYCAGFKNGTSVCNGDSGGGMVFPKTGSDPNNPVWEIRGMVSISVALQNQFVCDSSHYVVFTDTAKYSDWIDNALNV